jgi:hypothetical protein
MSRPARALLLALAIGVALGALIGVGARMARTMPADGPLVASLGAPWLVIAFAAGALAGGRGMAALAGATTVVTGTLTYYALYALAGGGGRYALIMTVAWSGAGAAVAAGFGCAGSAWRRARAPLGRAATAGIVAGALVGEAVLLGVEWASPWAERALVTELLAGLLIAVVLAPGRRVVALIFTAAAAGVFVIGEGLVRETLRAAGWVGA